MQILIAIGGSEHSQLALHQCAQRSWEEDRQATRSRKI